MCTEVSGFEKKRSHEFEDVVKGKRERQGKILN